MVGVRMYRLAIFQQAAQVEAIKPHLNSGSGKDRHRWEGKDMMISVTTLKQECH
jgi:hypothetical protein